MYIDLRSDTVTHPTPAMRKAMYEAEVGDDVYGEDPTINRLQELAAKLTGKEAALFVPTGTMGNAIAQLTHAGRGQAVIVGDQSHIYHYEAGGASTLGGSPMYVVPTHPDGMLDMDALRGAIADESDEHTAATALICLENSHNRCGGTVLSQEQVAAIATLAHTNGIAVHMDGARIFNAATALGIPVRDLVRDVDSVMFCLSKGLSAPVGSMLVGSREFIRRARRTRKLLGGGMRQAGVLAAAGIVALEEMVERLAEDHENCERLAYGLADLPMVSIQTDQVVTNILLFSLHNADGQEYNTNQIALFLNKAREHGVLLGPMGEKNIRAVTHHGIEAEHIDQALAGIQAALQEIAHLE
ncbi:threonine aldolase [Dictyobacter alpinus]|uniref:Threonine aldolase n=1 Tax=Dictyobacter alpinus TaxID=2014873 RepID=A0A402BAD5_9CHLR|nr:low-specificity L-threonine aldolase [Dictyobacter alpinus]GCE28257.1 threonine aldolase [Dictyobacter alpinus]